VMGGYWLNTGFLYGPRSMRKADGIVISVAFLTRGRKDGFVKSPISALRFIPRHCGVR
jgi:hypothetical protein